MSCLVKLSFQFFITVSPSNFVYLKNSFSLTQKFISYVPAHSPVTKPDINKLTEFLLRYEGGITVLTGAGVSTESGIPDYRSKDVGLFARSNHKPMTYQIFVESDIGRKRYWARSFIAWPNYSLSAPNIVHNAIQTLEEKKFISTVITQNVDSLHYKAGSKKVIELHGSLYRVICIKCNKYTLDRYKFQEMLESMNPKFNVTPQMVRPDGDVDLPEEYVHSFNIPSCPRCDGYLKPDVTFFGESIPIERVEKARRAIDESSALLVLGSSVTVFSAYRILLQANETNKPIFITNIGPTRGDELATIKISARCGEVLEKVLLSLR